MCGGFAFPFETSMRELLAVERERDENIPGNCNAYSCSCRRRDFGEIDVTWEGILDAGRYKNGVQNAHG